MVEIETHSQPLLGDPGQVPEVGVGMLGYGFMGKAHSNAYKKLSYMIYLPPAIPRLVCIAGRKEEAVQAAAVRYGYERFATDWRDMLRDDRIQLFDNVSPNDVHAGPCIEAARAGKHILCEKPLARSAREAAEMLEAVIKAGVKHMTGFNYRFVPAIRLARELIETGRLGEIYHYRAIYLQESMANPMQPITWRQDHARAGSGALGNLGVHIIDLARFLVGEPRHVSGLTRTFIKERPIKDAPGVGHVTVDDAFAAVMEFESGAMGTLEASRFSLGRKNYQLVEVNGSKGSLRFNLERLNELEVYWNDEEPRETRGFHTVLVTEPEHPFMANWWPRGHIIGWEHTFVHEIAHLLDAIVGDKEIGPYGATFADGYKAAVICDAIIRSNEKGQQVLIEY